MLFVKPVRAWSLYKQQRRGVWGLSHLSIRLFDLCSVHDLMVVRLSPASGALLLSLFLKKRIFYVHVIVLNTNDGTLIYFCIFL